jgi:hypothetical protein
VVPGGDDRQLAKRLHRDARAAAKLQLRAELAHAKAVRRRERRLAKARAALPRRAVVAVGLGAASVPLEGFWGFTSGGVALLAGLAACRSVAVLRSRSPERVPSLPAVPAVPMPPPARSVAFPAVRRLEAVRHELRRMLPLVAPAGRDAAEEAWQAASEADLALRWQAARLAAVEPHRGADPELLRALEDGVGCQERLVVAVADLVAASADPLAATRLQDASDRLHGLAQGLREVR